MKEIEYSTESVRSLLIKNAADPKIHTDDKIVNDIAFLLNRWEIEDKRPLYAYCVVTGKKCAMTAKALFAKRKRKFGSVEKMMVSYTGRGAKAKTTRTVADDGTIIVEKLDADDPRAYRKFKTEMPNGQIDWWWRHPDNDMFNRSERDVNKTSVKEWPVDKRVQYYRELTADTCHGSQSVDNKCQDCQFAYICKVSCRKFTTDTGRVVREPNQTMIKHFKSNPSKYWVPTAEQIKTVKQKNILD
tara:strand:- start:1325 stop:2056 length:732 start_codon:yes stop_codon:yes gene_type:complete